MSEMNMLSLNSAEDSVQESTNENIFRRHITEDPKKKRLAQHRLWMETVQHEYPLPYQPYKIGVYIRFYNQTQYSDEVYLEKHKQWFFDDIALCPLWTLVDFYVDYGSAAPRMESSPEWCRLLGDCLSGKVDLIVTQKVGNVSEDADELAWITRVLASQEKPVGIYFISEDIFTLASYYREDMKERDFLPEGWQLLPKDEFDTIMIDGTSDVLHLGSGEDAEETV